MVGVDLRNMRVEGDDVTEYSKQGLMNVLVLQVSPQHGRLGLLDTALDPPAQPLDCPRRPRRPQHPTPRLTVAIDCSVRVTNRAPGVVLGADRGAAMAGPRALLLALLCTLLCQQGESIIILFVDYFQDGCRRRGMQN